MLKCHVDANEGMVMMIQTTEELAKIHSMALRTIELLPQDNATTIAKLYCRLRNAGENQAQAELHTSNLASRVIYVVSIREKNMWVRSGLDIGIDAWFKAYVQAMGQPSDSGNC